MTATHRILEKPIWTTDDFDRMGWHDSSVYAIAMLPDTFELVFDIDYIVQWNTLPDTTFSFWVAPATLVFEYASDIEMNIGPPSPFFEILALHRSDEELTPNGKVTTWLWHIEGDFSAAKFRANGYIQYFRQQPILTAKQSLTLDQRGGLSFARSMS